MAAAASMTAARCGCVSLTFQTIAIYLLLLTRVGFRATSLVLTLQAFPGFRGDEDLKPKP